MSPIEKINAFIKSIDYAENPEGSSMPDQILYYFDLFQRNAHIKTVVEIGFNLGISAASFLSSRSDVSVVSVDIGSHGYVLPAKRNIDRHFPNRHTLVIGDSATTIPFLHNFFGSMTVDLFMIDGDHREPAPAVDLANALSWCSEETYIIVDDVLEGNNGVNRAVAAAIAAHHVKLIEHKSTKDRGWVLLKRSFKL
jgi:predicted O-methyltransferase YrrM